MSKYAFKIAELPKYRQVVKNLGTAKHAVILTSKDDMLLDAIAHLIVMQSECTGKSPCFLCPNCQKILDGNAVDVQVFGNKKAIVVEDSESIVEASQVLPLEFQKKYFLLYNFESATIQAQNKLLKIIEEPREFDKYIILTKNLDAVLQTIKSRTQIFELPRFDAEELKSICDFKVGDGKKISFAVQYANGNLTTLTNTLENEEFAEIYALCRRILTNMTNSGMVLEFSSQIAKHKENIDMFFDILSVLYRDIVSVKLGRQNLVQNQEILSEILVLSNGISKVACLKILDEIQKSRQNLNFNANFSGVIDNLLLKILEIKHYASDRS